MAFPYTSIECQLSASVILYLKVIIICRYIFLRFWLKGQFARTKFYDFCMDVVKGRQFLIFAMYTTNVCGYKNLRFWANPQKYQTLIPAKNSHLKVTHATIGCQSSANAQSKAPEAIIFV